MLTSFRVYLLPYLPPPVVSLWRQTDEAILSQAGIDEASSRIVCTILAIIFLKLLLSIISSISNSFSSEGKAGAGANAEKELGLRGRKGGGRDAAVLVGAMGSGKTALLHRLAYGDRIMSTVTSVKVGEETVRKELVSDIEDDDDDDDESDECSVIDYPGHPRLRATLPAALKRAKIIVCVVDSSKGVAEAADVLYAVLTDKDLVKSTLYAEVRIIVVCNKSDLPLAKSSTRVKTQLTNELEKMRRTSNSMRAAIVGGKIDDEEVDEVPLGLEGKKLNLDDDLGLFKLTFHTCSVYKNEGIQELREQIVNHVNDLK
jgi:small GTP-binding protein